MRRCSILLLQLLLLVQFINAQDRKYLKWGSYQWEINCKTDTVDQLIVLSDPHSPSRTIKKEESRALDVTLKFTNTGKYEFPIGVTVTDSFFGINPETLEKWLEVNKFSKLEYEVYGGKISLSAFLELIQLPVLTSDMPHVKLTGGYVECYTPNVGRCWSFELYKTESTKNCEPAKGSCALIYFRYKANRHEKNIGSVLFEII